MVQLLARVLRLSAAARDYVVTERSLRALDTLFALLRCALPLVLKADIVRVLCALATAPQYARTLWEYLEEAQLLPAPASAPMPLRASSSVKEGARYELYEIEARTGDYAYTEALLALLDALVHVLVPPALGDGLRAPGIAPYVAFIVDDVLLALPTRTFTDAHQRHRLAALALSALHALLSAYTPAMAADDLAPRRLLQVQLDKDKSAPPPPPIALPPAPISSHVQCRRAGRDAAVVGLHHPHAPHGVLSA